MRFSHSSGLKHQWVYGQVEDKNDFETKTRANNWRVDDLEKININWPEVLRENPLQQHVYRK